MFCKQKSAFGHLKVDERRKTVSLERILSYLEAIIQPNSKQCSFYLTPQKENLMVFLL